MLRHCRSPNIHPPAAQGLCPPQQHRHPQRAKYGVEAAQQQRKEAFTKFFPNVSGTGLWFNANKGMAKMDIDPSGIISPELGASLAQMLPAEALAAMSNPISISMMKNGTIGSLMAVQPVFAGGQIINGNKLAKVGEDVSRLQMQLSENEVEKTVEQYFWQLASLQEKMKTINAVDTLLTDIYKDVDVAVRAGVAMRNDLLQVQLRQNDIESQRLKLQNGISIVKQLWGNIGLNYPAPLSDGRRGTELLLRHRASHESASLLHPSPIEKGPQQGLRSPRVSVAGQAGRGHQTAEEDGYWSEPAYRCRGCWLHLP